MTAARGAARALFVVCACNLACGGQTQGAPADAGRADTRTSRDAHVADIGSDHARLGDSMSMRLPGPDASARIPDAGQDAADAGSGLDGTIGQDAFMGNPDGFALVDGACPAEAAGVVVDAGAFGSCGENRCGSGQYCVQRTPPEAGYGGAVCLTIPGGCLCDRTCVCIQTQDPICGGGIACRREGDSVAIVCQASVMQ